MTSQLALQIACIAIGCVAAMFTRRKLLAIVLPGCIGLAAWVGYQFVARPATDVASIMFVSPFLVAILLQALVFIAIGAFATWALQTRFAAGSKGRSDATLPAPNPAARPTQVAGMVFLALAVIGVVWGMSWKLDQDTNRHAVNLAAEEEVILNFARNDSTIRRAAGTDFDVYVSIKAIDPKTGWPRTYDIGVKPKSGSLAERSDKTVYAIVDVSRSGDKPTFNVRCMTPLYFGQRGDDPCQQ